MVKRRPGQLSSSRRKKHSRAKGENEERIVLPRARGPGSPYIHDAQVHWIRTEPRQHTASPGGAPRRTFILSLGPLRNTLE